MVPPSQILVVTDPLTTNEFDVVVAVQASVQAMAFLEQMDITNAVVLKAYRLRLATGEYVRQFSGINLTNGERLRVRLDAGITGVIETDLFITIRPPLSAVS